ncbi:MULTISPECIES: hypothetical protein [unclassified Streptomyces]|nr:hypothetical protein [Streptomyces sp. NBC_01445]WSE06392.1 hypothetical protein OG574_25455 [Streptomyces sp. NBC_01445]
MHGGQLTGQGRTSTFVRSQEMAVGQLLAYFDRPLGFSRHLAAERIVADA